MTQTPYFYSQGIQDLAAAIAKAEGFYVVDSVPARANNPGDLKVRGWTGPTTGAEHIPCFPTLEDGWHALYVELQRIADGRSHVYDLSMTFAEMGQKWTDTQATAWTGNVIATLLERGYAVNASSTLQRVLG